MASPAPPRRNGDIPPLTEFFVAKFSARLNKIIDSIPDDVLEVLKGHNWPGNIRKLQNCIERAALFSPGSVLRLVLDLTHMVRQTATQNSESVPRTLADTDREHILETYESSELKLAGPGGRAPFGS
jgi:transcriptional regulator with PAS, ATPase and Fis domain